MHERDKIAELLDSIKVHYIELLDTSRTYQGYLKQFTDCLRERGYSIDSSARGKDKGSNTDDNLTLNTVYHTLMKKIHPDKCHTSASKFAKDALEYYSSGNLAGLVTIARITNTSIKFKDLVSAERVLSEEKRDIMETETAFRSSYPWIWSVSTGVVRQIVVDCWIREHGVKRVTGSDMVTVGIEN